jgi:hypothetical protein
MKRLLLFLLTLTASAFGQITVTSDQGAGWTCASLACSTFERQFGSQVYQVHYNVTGNGTISIGSITGTGSSGLSVILCTVASDPCTTTTNAPADLYAYYDGYTDYAYSVGAHTASIPVTGGSGGSFTLIINLTIVALSAPSVRTPGSLSGCSNSSSVFIDLDTCTPTQMRPTGNFSFAAVGSSITDSSFGGVVYTVATNVPPLVTATLGADAVVTPFNADGSLVGVNTNTGNGDLTSTTPPYTVLWHNPAGIYNGQSGKWSSLNPKAFFYYTGTTLHRATLGTAPAITSDIQIWNDADAGAVFNDGGDSEATKDDWLAQVDTVNKKLWLIDANCNTLNCATAYSISFASLPSFSVRAVLTTPGIDAVSGLRYFLLISFSPAAMEIYTFNGSALADAGRMPIGAGLGSYIPFGGYFAGKGTCTPAANIAGLCLGIAQAHSSGAEIAGQEYWCTQQGGRFQPTFLWFSCLRLNAGSPNMAIDTAAGGGMLQIFPANTNFEGNHTGCARQGQVCVVSNDDTVQQQDAWGITGAATSAGNINLTVRTIAQNGGANPLTLVTGNNVTVSNVGGCTNANGNQNNVTVSGTTITLTGVTCNGTYSGSTGVVYLNSTGFTANAVPQHGLDVDVIYMPSANISSMIVERLAVTRSLCFTDAYLENAPSPYFCQAHAAIAQDGSKVIWQSNNGLADTGSVYTAATGLSSGGPPPRLGGNNVFAGKNVIQ